MQDAAEKFELKIHNIGNIIRLIEIIYREIKQSENHEKEQATQCCINILHNFPAAIQALNDQLVIFSKQLNEDLIETLLDELIIMQPSKD